LKQQSLITQVILLLAPLALLPVFQAYLTSPLLSYRGFGKVYWEEGVPCGDKVQEPLICYNSKPIEQKGPILDLEYRVSAATAAIPPATLQVFTENGLLAAEFSLATAPDFFVNSWG
jgi:hypothetical protein